MQDVAQLPNKTLTRKTKLANRYASNTMELAYRCPFNKRLLQICNKLQINVVI